MLLQVAVGVVGGNRTCLQGWLKEKQSCYRVVKDKLPWLKAREYCSAMDSNILTVEDRDEQNFILQIPAVNTSHPLWVQNNTIWSWLDKNQTINNLDTSSINTVGSCAAMNLHGIREPTQCQSPLPFICETSVIGCPTSSGWIEHDFRCLFVLSTLFGWERSREECNQIGAELAVLNDLKADSFLQSLSRHDWLWVGLKFESDLQHYTWIDGRRGYIDAVTTLNPNQQDACGAVSVNHSTRQLISMTTTCSAKLYGVCEKAWITSRPTLRPFHPTAVGTSPLDSSFANNQMYNIATAHAGLDTDSTDTDRRTDSTNIAPDPWAGHLPDEKARIYTSVVNCLQETQHAACLDNAVDVTACQTDMFTIYTRVMWSPIIGPADKMDLIQYILTKLGNVFVADAQSTFCEQNSLNILGHLENMIGNAIVTTHLKDVDLSYSNMLDMSIFEHNLSHTTSPLYEGDIAGCVIQTISTEPSTNTIDANLTISVILTRTNNKEADVQIRENGYRYYIISAILTMSAYRNGRRANILHEFILLHTFEDNETLRHYLYRNTTQTVCAFYERRAKHWSTIGCEVLRTDNYTTVCKCNHTTSFAILMKVHDYQMTAQHQTALSVVTCIGCSISMIAMFITLTIFTCIRSLISERVFVHKNLCVSIMCAQVIFLAGIKATAHKIVCRVIAILLHYCYLSVFTWMLVEGLHLYTKVVQVFGTETSRISYYLFLGWGIPLMLVIVSTVADIEGYGTEHSCWLSIDRSTIWAFVGPAVAVIIINIVILVMVLRIVFSSVKLERPSQREQIMVAIKGMLFLLPLLGLTWIFGLLAINRNMILFEYAFAICNSLQGFFVFLFHCMLNSEVRHALQRVRDRQTLSLRGETTSQGTDQPSEDNKRRVRNTRFKISGKIRVSPAPSGHTINNAELELSSASLHIKRC